MLGKVYLLPQWCSLGPITSSRQRSYLTQVTILSLASIIYYFFFQSFLLSGPQYISVPGMLSTMETFIQGPCPSRTQQSRKSGLPAPRVVQKPAQARNSKGHHSPSTSHASDPQRQERYFPSSLKRQGLAPDQTPTARAVNGGVNTLSKR